MRRDQRPPMELAERVTPGAVFENEGHERMHILQVKSFGPFREAHILTEVVFAQAVTPMDFDSKLACAEWLEDGGFKFVGHEFEDKA